MHHAVQVVGPALGALTPVGQRHAGFTRQGFATGIHLRIGDVKHRHGVGAETELVVPHDGAHAPQRTLVQPLLQRGQNGLGCAAQDLCPVVEGAGRQGKAGFQQGGQRPVGRGDGGGCGSFGHGVGGGVRAQIETQIDAVGAPHGQLQGVQAGRCVQAAHGVLDSVRVGAGHHEPQIVGVLALVVVVDARVL